MSLNFNNNDYYNFDNNNQDDVIYNGVDNDHSIEEFNNIDCSMNDLDTMDYKNNEVYYEY